MITSPHLDRVRELMQQQGSLTPEDLVRDGRARSSPLHTYFEWDNNTAASEYRLIQAQLLLITTQLRAPEKRALGVKTDATVRAFINIGSSRYAPVEQIVGNVDVLGQELQRMHQQLLGVLNRYRTFLSVSKYRQFMDRLDQVLGDILIELNKHLGPDQIAQTIPRPPAVRRKRSPAKGSPASFV